MKLKKKLPDIARMREYLAYDPDTGVITWLKPKANNGKAGKPTGCLSKSTGYLYVVFDYTMVAAHRVAWALHHGEWPNGEIDHINNDRADNRLANLRIATRRQNAVNQPGRGSNTGVKGVYWYKNRYMALARDQNGKTTYLGRHKTLESAKAAYDEFVIKTRGEFARTD